MKTRYPQRQSGIDRAPVSSAVHNARFWLVVSAWLAGPAALSSAQFEAASSAKGLGEGLSGLVFRAWQGNSEVARCGLCHYQPGNPFAARATDLYKMSELKQWLEEDKHAITRQRIEPISSEQRSQKVAESRRLLKQNADTGEANIEIPESWVGASNELSYQMCAELGYDISTPDGYAMFRDNCLTCHAGYETGRPSADMNSPRLDVPGIGCNVCHQAGENDQWIEQHSTVNAATTWRGLSPDAKQQSGMRDLSTSVELSRLCADCHVGNLQKGRFVTHAMFAAGHPPLPAIEMHTLVRSMPRHWQLPSGQAAPSHAQETAIGALIIYRQWLQLVVDAGRLGERWGDWALYECAACHHHLQPGNLRQELRSPGSPGRPRFAQWPAVVPRAIAANQDAESSFDQAYAQLLAAYKQRPFADRTAAIQSALAMQDFLDKSRGQLQATDLDGKWLLRFQQRVTETPPEWLLEYQSARVVALTMQALNNQLSARAEPVPGSLQSAIASLGAASDPSTQPGGVNTALPHGPSLSIYPEHTRAELLRQQAYDPRLFIQQLRACNVTTAPQP